MNSGMPLRIAWLACLAAMALAPSRAAADQPGKDRAYFEQRGEIVWEVPTPDHVIALTFDDGPDPHNTPALLDLLKAYDAKATFFVIGKRVKRFPELVRREQAEGHEIANHTHEHMYFFGKSTAAIERQMSEAHSVIVAATGRNPVWFRPPGGQYNEKIVEAAKRQGYRLALWSWHQDTKDWRSPGTKRIVDKVLNNARGGDIVLFHDYVDGRWQTLEALKVILPELKSRGYRFVTLTELMEQYGKGQPKAGG